MLRPHEIYFYMVINQPLTDTAARYYSELITNLFIYYDLALGAYNINHVTLSHYSIT